MCRRSFTRFITGPYSGSTNEAAARNYETNTGTSNSKANTTVERICEYCRPCSRALICTCIRPVNAIPYRVSRQHATVFPDEFTETSVLAKNVRNRYKTNQNTIKINTPLSPAMMVYPSLFHNVFSITFPK